MNAAYRSSRNFNAVTHAVAPECLETDDECVPLDCCVDAGNLDGDVLDDVVVNLGLSGDVKVDLCDAVLIEDGLAFLRKTRAGGNWLTGGIVTEEM
jgi:hypothetical protein